jgi:hypothetical protein
MARVVTIARADLPDTTELPDTGGDPAVPGNAERDLAGQMLQAVAHQCPDPAVVFIAYGPATPATGVLDATRAVFTLAGIRVVDTVRVTDGRYFHHGCPDLSCTAGIPFDPASAASAASATYRGLVALPDRDTMAAQVTPVTGPDQAGMAAVTRGALDQLAGIPAVRATGVTAVDAAILRHRRGDRCTDEQAARLTVLLANLAVRDHAWARIDNTGRDIGPWADLTRRAQADLAAAPASLLAYAAWQRGDGALANVAIDRALTADPGYRMARLLAVALQAGLPPTSFTDRPAANKAPTTERRPS